MNFKVLIEIPEGTNVKYEWDEKAHQLVLDRILPTPMRFPVSYGFILDTLADDGDALDVIVFFSQPPVPGTVVGCRAIGVLDMEDEAGYDAKIVCVPLEKIDFEFGHWQSLADIPEARKKTITHFFEHYKDLESDKWVKVTGWKDSETAEKLILKSRKTS